MKRPDICGQFRSGGFEYAGVKYCTACFHPKEAHMKLTPTDEAAMGTVTAETDLTVPDLLKADKGLAEKLTKTNALVGEPDENGWMPIDDASGGEIIAGWWSAGVWMVRPAWYDHGFLWKEQGFGHRIEAEGWWSYVNSVGQEKIYPTHFLPHTSLPAPPKDEPR